MAVTTIDLSRRRVRSARDIAHLLGAADEGAAEAFSTDLVWNLPEPARRWLGRAIAPGAPLPRRAEFRMHGEIKLGLHWHDFTAEQVLVPEVGFVWSAHTHVTGVPVTGLDSYFDGVGSMRWRMLGVPMVRRDGGAVNRSAFGRLAAESVLLPSSLVDATWRHSAAPDAAVFTHIAHGADGHAHVAIDVAADGHLVAITMHRWGNPLGLGYQLQPFAVSFAGEYDAGTLRVPDEIVASWPTAGGEFYRASLDLVTLSKGPGCAEGSR